MDITVLLIGLAIIIAIIIIGKILKIVTKILFIIILLAAIALGIFIWQKDNIKILQNKTSYNIEFTAINP